MKRVATLTLALAAAYGCKSTGSTGSALRDTGDQAGAASEGVVGLDILTNTPATTMIDLNIQPSSDWGYSSGREYWLYSTRGQYMTFSPNDKYAPYQNRAACNGREDDSASACSVQVGNVAKACQHVASLTLKAILDDEPEEYKSLKQQFGGSFSPFGWMNDGHSDAAYAKATWQGPFIWRGSQASIQANGACPSDFTSVGGYIKWVSSVDKNGKCLTPSKGQFLALIKKARQCLEQNSGSNN